MESTQTERDSQRRSGMTDPVNLTPSPDKIRQLAPQPLRDLIARPQDERWTPEQLGAICDTYLDQALEAGPYPAQPSADDETAVLPVTWWAQPEEIEQLNADGLAALLTHCPDGGWSDDQLDAIRRTGWKHTYFSLVYTDEETALHHITPNVTPRSIRGLDRAGLESLLENYSLEGMTADQLVATSFAAAAAVNSCFDYEQVAPSALDVWLAFPASEVALTA